MTERPALVIDRIIGEMKRVDWETYCSTRPGLMFYVVQGRKAISALRVEIAKNETWEELGPEPKGPSVYDLTEDLDPPREFPDDPDAEQGGGYQGGGS